MSEINEYVAARVNALLVESAKNKRSPYNVTPLRLQKLIYLNYGMYLKKHNTFLTYLSFEAWTYGPVIAEIYHYYKQFGGNLITKKVSMGNGIYPRLENDDTIQSTIRKYSTMDAFELVVQTHKQGGAWHKAIRKNKEIHSNTPIEHSDIQEEFCSGE
jgi:uncharacterized phage-associated protein